MSKNVFDISVDGEGSGGSEPSFEPPAYLPSSVPGQAAPAQPAADPAQEGREVPHPPVPPTPPAPPVPPAGEFMPSAPSSAEFMPSVVPQETVEVSTPKETDEVSQALLNAPPPQPVAPASPEPVASAQPMAPSAPDVASASPRSGYHPVSEPVSLKPVFEDSAPRAHGHRAAPTEAAGQPVDSPKTEDSPMSSPTGQSPADFPPPQPADSAPAPAYEMTRDPKLNPDPDLDEALQKVLMLSGSDLHVSVGAPPMIRVDGSLKPIAGEKAWSQEKVTEALLSILTPAQRERLETTLEFDFAYTLSANARFRVNYYWQRHNIGAAFRLIPTEIKSLRELGVPDVVGNFANLARGLVLITGPTGSGKSTTLAGLIDIVNRHRSDHIMTVEDPIEFLHTNHKSLVNQREVGHDTHSFAAALKHVLRQDPDVILVGELRDLETISVALTAAETGHLVFATLHTQDAPQTIDRIIDVYPPHQQNQVRAQLAATLQGVVCQTLVKRSGGKGRVVATEVLVGTHAVANLIREGKTYQVQSAMQAGRDLGMHTMDQHLADLVNTGQITMEGAVEKAHDLEVLKRLISRVDDPALAGAMSGGIDFGDQFSVGR